MAISFIVYGMPQTAGSKRAFPFHRKDGSQGVRVTDDNPRTKNWQACVRDAAVKVFQHELMSGPLFMELRFVLPRPKGHFGTGRNATKLKASAPAWPDKKPDCTKLVRAVEDALTGIVWRDDAQIVNQFVEKQYGEPARVEILIGAMNGHEA